jgi:hypothetical protein
MAIRATRVATRAIDATRNGEAILSASLVASRLP